MIYMQISLIIIISFVYQHIFSCVFYGLMDCINVQGEME